MLINYCYFFLFRFGNAFVSAKANNSFGLVIYLNAVKLELKIVAQLNGRADGLANDPQQRKLYWINGIKYVTLLKIYLVNRFLFTYWKWRYQSKHQSQTSNRNTRKKVWNIFKDNNKDMRTDVRTSDIRHQSGCQWRRCGVFLAGIKNISHLFLVSTFSTLNSYLTSVAFNFVWRRQIVFSHFWY